MLSLPHGVFVVQSLRTTGDESGLPALPFLLNRLTKKGPGPKPLVSAGFFAGLRPCASSQKAKTLTFFAAFKCEGPAFGRASFSIYFYFNEVSGTKMPTLSDLFSGCR
jgi:hypothetical protein